MCPDDLKNRSALTKNAKQVLEAVEDLEEPPFLKACKDDPELIKGRPVAGKNLMDTSVDANDNRGNKTTQFLDAVGAKLKANLEANTNIVDTLIRCLSSQQASSDSTCNDVKTWIDKPLKEYVKETRSHLAVAQSEHQLRSYTKVAWKGVNKDLASLGSRKELRWEKVTEKELSEATRTLRSYEIEAAKAEMESKNTSKVTRKTSRGTRRLHPGFMNDYMLVKRYGHFNLYRSRMAELPILQYLKSAEPSRGEVLSAALKMKEDLNKEWAEFNKRAQLLKKAKDEKSPLHPSLLAWLGYNVEVESVLLEQPQACGLAMSLLEYDAGRERAKALAIGLPLLAVSIVAPPVAIAAGGLGAGIAVGLAIGAGSQTYYAIESDKEKNTSTRLMTTRMFYGAENPEYARQNLDRAGIADRQAKLDKVFLAVAYGGVGSAGTRFLSVQKASYFAARSQTAVSQKQFQNHQRLSEIARAPLRWAKPKNP